MIQIGTLNRPDWLAKCYCKDCYYYDDGRCFKHDGWYTAEDWFCWEAEPKIIDPDKEEDKNV